MSGIIAKKPFNDNQGKSKFLVKTSAKNYWHHQGDHRYYEASDGTIGKYDATRLVKQVMHHIRKTMG